MTFDVSKQELVPKHSKLNDSEKKKLFEDYKIDSKSLPKILDGDPAIANLKAKAGDVIRIDRESKTAGTTIYYRAVIES